MNLWHLEWFSWRSPWVYWLLSSVFSSICLPLFVCFWASNNLNFLCKLHVFSRECYGPWVEIYRPDTAQFVAENIWHSPRLAFSQTSVGLAINCFLWDKTQAPLPSVENHLMEGVVTLRPICSHDWLTALPLSCLPPPSPFVSIPLSPFSITPTPCSAVCLDQTAPASISDFQSISGTAPLAVVCLSVSLQSTHCRREWKLNPSGTQTDSIHHLHISLNNSPGTLPSLLPLSTILSVLYIQLGSKVEKTTKKQST